MELIPVVDFSALSLLVSDDSIDESAAQSTSDQLFKAFTTIGFVYLSNTAFPKSLLEKIDEIGGTFFALPNEVKQRYQIQPDNFGWAASEQERVQESRPGDLKESFNAHLHCLHDDSRWPSEVQDFKQVALEFFKTSARLAERVLSAMARGLRLTNPNFFKQCHHMNSIPGGTTIRMLYYPPLPNDSEVKPRQVRLGEHTDYGSITLLFQGETGGLQVKNREGRWVDASPIPDTVLVNIGDLMQRWTSDRFVSNSHRILIPEEDTKRRQVRRSVAFFVHPDPDFVVVPLDGSGKYPPTTDQIYLRERLDATYTYTY